MGAAPFAVLFDLDGTLVDSHALILQAFRHAAHAVLGRTLTDDETRMRWGEPLPARFAALAPDAVAALVAEYSTYYDAHREIARPFRGVPDMLTDLRGRGARLGVITSKRRRPAAQSLDVCGLAWAIDALVAAEDAPAPKPDRAPVDLAVRRLDAQHRRTVFVGDGVLDIGAARAAGVRAAGALWGAWDAEALRQTDPDDLLASPADVVELVARLMKALT